MPDQQVYFIQAGAGGPIKIGVTADVRARLKQLQTSSSETLVLLGHRDGGEDLERELHEKFAAHRLRGEWFAPADCIFHEIAEAVARPTLADGAEVANPGAMRSAPSFLKLTFIAALHLAFGDDRGWRKRAAAAAGASVSEVIGWYEGDHWPNQEQIDSLAQHSQAFRDWSLTGQTVSEIMTVASITDEMLAVRVMLSLPACIELVRYDQDSQATRDYIRSAVSRYNADPAIGFDGRFGAVLRGDGAARVAT